MVGLHAIALRARGFAAAMEQVGLHALQQAGVVAFGGIGIRGDLAGRMRRVVTAQQGHEVLAGGTPVAQQRVLAGLVAERIDALAQACAERLQVARVMFGRHQQVRV